MYDLRFAWRQLLKNPAFTAVAVLTLAVCLGANLTIFAVVDAVLVRPLPFPEPDRLVTMFNTYPKAGVERNGASLANYYERRGNISAFSQVAILSQGTAIVGEAGSTDQMDLMRVSPEFFTTLGVDSIRGRAFREEEMTYQTDGVAILTDSYWRHRCNADPHILGRQIRVDGFQKTIMGVLSPGFRFLSSNAQLYLPLSSNPRDRESTERHSSNGYEMIARLKPGVSLAEAQSQIDANNDAHAEEYPDAKMVADAGFRTVVALLHADHVKAIRPTLLLMQAGVLFLLLIGGVNLVNLLLIRASSRAKELAVRQSLGASDRHVVGATKQTELTEDAGQGAVYVPYQYRTVANVFAVVRTRQAPEGFGLALQKIVRAINPELPVNDLRSMEVRIADSLVARRSPALLAAIFASVALMLAAIGTYGVLAYAVTQRRREIGVRMALGALPKQIGKQFLSLGLRLLVTGTIFGVIGAWWAGSAMQRVLFNVPALHPVILVGTGVVMTIVSLVACLLPTLRAAKVDPMEALRGE